MREHPEFNNVMPLLLRKNDYSQQQLFQYRKAGFFDYIIKPVQPTELTSTLTTSWQRWSSHFKAEEDRLREYNPSILLVEDNPISHKIVRMMLERLGCSVDVVETGKETLQVVFDKDYDLIFIDLGLPDIDGLTLARKIRGVQDKKSCIPMVALTAHVSEVDREKCIEAGMSHFLAKPASPESLKRVVSRCILADVPA